MANIPQNPARESCFVQGKAKWVKSQIPDMFGKYSMNLYPDEASMDKIKKLKEGKDWQGKRYEGIKNKIKRDDDGDYLQLSSPVEKMVKGVKRILPPPTVVEADGVTPFKGNIGNGSDVTVKLEVYYYTPPMSRSGGTAARLMTIRIDNLVEFNPVIEGDRQPREIKGLWKIPAEPAPF